MYVKSPFTDEQVISPAEKRTLERRHLMYYLRVWDTQEDKLIGHLADVSSEGFLIVGENQIELDREFQLKMMLPATADSAEPLEFRANSCWSSNDVNKLFYDTGFQFTDISNETRERLNSIIQEYSLTS
jgi:hypothetical protein